MRFKSIAYAYPTSPDAIRFGFTEAGCFTVDIHEGHKTPRAIHAFATFREAKADADSMPEDWHPAYLKTVKPEPPTIYQQLTAAGVPVDSHESDLYAKVTPESREIVAKYEHKGNVTTFTNQIDGERWYDIPFAYDPFW